MKYKCADLKQKERDDLFKLLCDLETIKLL